MKRGDVTVLSISAALGAVVVVAVAYSLLVLDRSPSTFVNNSARTDSSWLVVTWGPSFCEAEPSDPRCSSGQVARMGSTLILHGLWPQPSENQFCGMPEAVADRARKSPDSDMPPLQLSDEVKKSLQSTMAGFDTLAPHEWYAHGTCSGVTIDRYFSDAAALTIAVRKVLDPVFQNAKGGRLTLGTVRDRVDEQFGAGAGGRVGLTCRKVTGNSAVVVDVRFSLPPVADLNGDNGLEGLGELLANAKPMASECRRGRVP